LINRKKGLNKKAKGFTLVELMIVIVIVGILSAVALPSFLSQRGKAESTEAIQQIGLMLKEAKIMHLENLTPAQIATNLNASKPANDTGDFNYTAASTGTGATAKVCVAAEANANSSLNTETNKHLGGELVLATQQPVINSTLVAAAPTCA
jgi:type IV pilus assembly protein PilA